MRCPTSVRPSTKVSDESLGRDETSFVRLATKLSQVKVKIPKKYRHHRRGCHFLTFQDTPKTLCTPQTVSRCSKALVLLVLITTHSCCGRALRHVLHSSAPPSLHHRRALTLVHRDEHRLGKNKKNVCSFNLF